MRTAATYMRLTEAIEYFEEWLDFWNGVRRDPPSRPEWISPNDAMRFKILSQSVVRAA